MNVEQIVFFQLSKLLVQGVSPIKIKLVVVVVIVQLNQVQLQQLLKPSFEPALEPRLVLVLPRNDFGAFVLFVWVSAVGFNRLLILEE